MSNQRTFHHADLYTKPPTVIKKTYDHVCPLPCGKKFTDSTHNTRWCSAECRKKGKKH